MPSDRSPVRAAADPGQTDPSQPPHSASAAELRTIAVRALSAAGTDAGTADVVADSLVASDLAGHDSHGVRRLISYRAAIDAGQVDPTAHPELRTESGSTAVVDGGRGFGQPAARLAAQTAGQLAAEHGTAAVSVARCAHVGRLGEYTASLADAGLAGLAMCNFDPCVAPFGGRERRMGTNPLSLAVPRAAGTAPIVMDWATAAMAEGKLAVARSRGEPVPEGVVVDADGNPSTDPSDFYDGGALVAMAAHKGSGLSVIIELLAGLLSGGGVSALPDFDESNGTLIVALDIGRFTDPDRFREQAEAFCALLSATAPAAGSTEVLVPGEPEARAATRRRREGVEVPGAIWEQLQELTHR